MIKVDNIHVYNLKNAIYSARNPLESWDKSDSINDDNIGENDLKLAQRLVLAGTDHSKFMRQIFVSMDITAPLYIWSELDTYKVGTVANSESKMHKLSSTPITKDRFSFDSLDDDDCSFYLDEYGRYYSFQDISIIMCEILRQKYLKTKDKQYWRQLIQLLPEGWNQKRTWTANYQVLRNIYFARKGHKLSEWEDFRKVIESLPYANELICIEKGD